jgi:hypothetical protein
MEVCKRVDIKEGKRMLVLVDFVARRFTTDYPAEDAGQ